LSRKPNFEIEGLSNHIAIAKKVKDIIVRFDPKAKVYLFSSVVKGRHTAASDIHLLIITEGIDLKYDMMVEVFRVIETPIELHITTMDKFKNWYRRFIKDGEIIEVSL